MAFDTNSMKSAGFCGSSKLKKSTGSGMRRRGSERERGFPKTCSWCGENSVMRTSRTVDNPGRIFHCCPNGSEQEKNHLFKWTDEGAVEEIEDIKISTEENFGKFEKRIEELGNVVIGLENELKEVKDKIHDWDCLCCRVM